MEETQKDYSTGSLESVIDSLKTNIETGLTEKEVKERLAVYGENKLREAEKEPMWKKLLEQFKDIMVVILIIAAVISGFLGDVIESVIILAIVIINAVLGVYQEGKAEQAVEALQKMSAPHARVLRDGKQSIIDASDLVPGDIIILEAGDIIPADARIIESSNMKVEEAALTGESVPVEKDATFETDETLGIGDRHNMLYSSTAMTYGRGQAVAVATGENTEMGKIAERLAEMTQELTPLQINMNQLGKFIAAFCVVVVIITFVVGFIKGGDPLDLFMTSVSLAVAAIPEGLTAVITIVLSLGMNRMAKKNAIVKRLLAVETLGSVNVICSDKTGTLTQNEMTVTKIYTGNTVYDVTGTGYEPKGEIRSQNGSRECENSVLDRLLEISALCNEAVLVEKEDGLWGIMGDPTEGAILSCSAKKGFTNESALAKYPRLGDLPFDSNRKMMSVFHEGFAEGKLSLTKGAPDIILDRCVNEMTESGVIPLTEERKEEILKANSAFAQTALRVLAFAYKCHPDGNFDSAETEMTFAGLMGMIDLARPEAKDAIAICTAAGIRAVMITGDYKDTAVAIAKDLGLMNEGDNVLTGAELDKMSDEELRAACGHTAVYTRVSPEHKVKIVEALQAEGNICSMTGDGVNDAPSLKKADIGVAMGITGTEVAKGASDMILTDDNFATIVSAVEEGRIIYSNIRKFVGFLLSCNVAEIFVIFITMLVMGPNMIPLLPIQLLWLNLVTDSFPALALGQERGEADIMQYPPRKKTDKIMNREMVASVAVCSIAIFLCVFIAFQLGIQKYGVRDGKLDTHDHSIQYMYVQDTVEGMEGYPEATSKKDLVNVKTGEILRAEDDYKGLYIVPSYGAMTYAFVALIFAELLKAYSMRSEHFGAFKIGIFGNSTLNKATVLCVLLTLLVIYVPALDIIFNTISFDVMDWLTILPCIILPFLAGEVFKKIYYRTRKPETMNA